MRKWISEETDAAVFKSQQLVFSKFMVTIIEILSKGVCRLRHTLMCKIEPYFPSEVFEVCLVFVFSPVHFSFSW